MENKPEQGPSGIIIKGEAVKRLSALEKINSAITEAKTRKAEKMLGLSGSIGPQRIAHDFLFDAIDIYKITPRQAAQIMWCVANQADSYILFYNNPSVYKHGQEYDSYMEEVGEEEWQEGLKKVQNPKLFEAGKQTGENIVSLMGRKEIISYEIKFQGTLITLDRVYILNLNK